MILIKPNSGFLGDEIGGFPNCQKTINPAFQSVIGDAAYSASLELAPLKYAFIPTPPSSQSSNNLPARR
jgi:hypothetical protein